MKWTTNAGAEIDMRAMTDSHIVNTMNMLERKGFTGTEHFGGMGEDGPWYDESAVDLTPKYLGLLREQVRRLQTEVSLLKAAR